VTARQNIFSWAVYTPLCGVSARIAIDILDILVK
jgi:hypothetical protein